MDAQSLMEGKLEGPFPKVAVFDIDYTLWPFWVDTHVERPFKLGKGGKVTDKRGFVIEYYPDVEDILKLLKANGVYIALASRTHDPPAAKELLGLVPLPSGRTLGKHNDFVIATARITKETEYYVDHEEIYPSRKMQHFSGITKASGAAYTEMVFFDDEPRNISDISKLGVICVLCDKAGITKAGLAEALSRFRKSKQ